MQTRRRFQPRWLISFLTAALVVTARVDASDVIPSLSEFSRTHWTEADGLPHSVVAIAQHPDGYLWLGTLQGLVRFDGVRFVLWGRQTRNPVLFSAVMSLAAARDGSLWIGGWTGITQLRQDGTTVTYSAGDGLAGGSVRALLESRDGTIWAAGQGGVSRFMDRRWQHLGVRHGLPDVVAYTLYEDGHGSLWVTTSAGLFRRRPGTDGF